jgi:hypothetical protein
MYSANMLLQVYCMQKPRYSPISTSSMRTAALIIALALAALFLVMPVMAHAPSDMVLAYDRATGDFAVTITHPVDDPATHYINQVQVRHNNRVISDPLYKSQPTKDTFTYHYQVDAVPGDTFWVLAVCSKGGSLEKKFDVPVAAQVTNVAASAAPAAPQAPAPVPTTQKSPVGLLPVFGAAAVLLLRKI